MKTLRLKNHNNKFASDYFGLIAPAPIEPVTNVIQPFKIVDRDGIVPDFLVERITMTRFYLSEIPEIFAYTACGDSPDKIKYELLKQYTVDIDREFAYYLFKKI